MAAIKGRNTKPELQIRKALHARGFRYRLHVRDLPGKPDLVFPRYRAVVFVNGCFWHGHECEGFRWPKTRSEFWRQKIGNNKLRDASDISNLEAEGWRAVVVWECDIRANARENMGLIEGLAKWIRSGTN